MGPSANALSSDRPQSPEARVRTARLRVDLRVFKLVPFELSTSGLPGKPEPEMVRLNPPDQYCVRLRVRNRRRRNAVLRTPLRAPTITLGKGAFIASIAQNALEAPLIFGEIPQEASIRLPEVLVGGFDWVFTLHSIGAEPIPSLDFDGVDAKIRLKIHKMQSAPAWVTLGYPAPQEVPLLERLSQSLRRRRQSE